MFAVIPEAISISIHRYGFYEEDLSKMVLTHLKPGMVFLDIGAHFGYFTLLGSFLVGKEGQVHSFEPSPSSYLILAANASGKRNIVVNNCAAFSKRGVISIYDYGIRYSAFNSIYGARLPQDVLSKLTVSKFEIESISIDEYVNKNKIVPGFVKIDAENAEYEILAGMDKTIDMFHPIISIEVGDIGARRISESKELISFLINKTYKAYEFKEGKIVPHSNIGRERYSYGNLLFLLD
jgi:FkbM family methyltransferase